MNSMDTFFYYVHKWKHTFLLLEHAPEKKNPFVFYQSSTNIIEHNFYHLKKCIFKKIQLEKDLKKTTAGVCDAIKEKHWPLANGEKKAIKAIENNEKKYHQIRIYVEGNIQNYNCRMHIKPPPPATTNGYNNVVIYKWVIIGTTFNNDDYYPAVAAASSLTHTATSPFRPAQMLFRVLRLTATTTTTTILCVIKCQKNEKKNKYNTRRKGKTLTRDGRRMWCCAAAESKRVARAYRGEPITSLRVLLEVNKVFFFG